MKGQSEEADLPPTEKKLRDARRKGQIFRGPDLVAATTTSAVLIILWLSLGDLRDSLHGVLNELGGVSTRPFPETAARLVDMLALAAVLFLSKLMIAGVGVSILTNLIVSGGFLFAMEPMKPKADHLDPVEGLKRMFGTRGVIELAKTVLKLLLLTSCCVGIGIMSANAILRAPTCGIACVAPLFGAAVQPLLVAGGILLLAAGLADLPVQRWLFRRQMRMTRTELKRERKEQDGIPEIRKAQQRGRRELLAGGAATGAEATTLFIEGDNVVVGLRYVRGETPVPVLTCKGRGVRAEHLLALAGDVTRVADPDLAAELDRQIEIGSFISDRFFDPVARALHLAAAQAG
ncbi:EscU/YscU/HrcU family type III secretion system export apparatus switch protein [Bradyrhizobium sp. USDA 4353]